ncbi:hypothetical protein Desaci_2543 [Desulfosporosinus acidiphilus SJ4]|uniref:Uncharacterized protein n=1 Tax=Desulfosporosinus acidiphilus (strain DSM 22704 / JCM 16185 / SJ4) TaxID=646529 RepID=I4D6R1_DESAJ|nr:hypothetical protein Desaci_2543 [Desulfosporosinus acidiphilus SJ4]
MGGNPIQFDYTALFIFIFPIVFFALIAYLIVNVVRYLKRKDKNDKEMIQKMDELIKLHRQSNNHLQ